MRQFLSSVLKSLPGTFRWSRHAVFEFQFSRGVAPGRLAALCASVVCVSLWTGAVADDSLLEQMLAKERQHTNSMTARRPEFLQSIMSSTDRRPNEFSEREDEESQDVEFGDIEFDDVETAEDASGRAIFATRRQSSVEALDRPLSVQVDDLLASERLDVDPICSESECATPLRDENDQPILRIRRTFYQGSNLSFGFVNDDPATGISARTLDASATFAMPIKGDMNNLISFTPYIRADLLDAAAVFDVPDQLFDTGMKFFWRKVINDRLSSMVLVSPSYRSDFESSDGAFRIFGMGLMLWQCVPEKLTLSGGVVHTGRADFPILPALGLLWTPTPEWRFDLQFPSPRISYRLLKDGQNSETWAYLNGVFGGNTWAVQRPSGTADELTIRDLRLVVGIEHLLPKNRGLFVETGYVFSRSVEYTRIPSEQELDSAIMLRGGISF